MAQRRVDRAYEHWTPEEDNILRRDQYRTVRELARILGRQQGAVRSRLRKLRLTETPPTRRRRSRSVRRGARSQRSAYKSVFYQPKPMLVERSVDLWPRRWWIALAVLVALVGGFIIGRATAPMPESSRPVVQERGSASSNAEAGVFISLPQHSAGVVGVPDDLLTLVSWNIRGYPEKLESDTAWFHAQLTRVDMDVLCIQEIANLDRLAGLQARDGRLVQFAFEDSRLGVDNAILADGRVALEDMSNPAGFQHPPQVAYVSYNGFDAVVVCLHLTWTDEGIREQEMDALCELLPGWLEHDPDVILVGDFNLSAGSVASLARRMGMMIMSIGDQGGIGTTHSGNRYDHFMISADLASEEAVCARIETFEAADLVIAQRVSDHLPVVATFRTDSQFRDRAFAD